MKGKKPEATLEDTLQALCAPGLEGIVVTIRAEFEGNGVASETWELVWEVKDTLTGFRTTSLRWPGQERSLSRAIMKAIAQRREYWEQGGKRTAEPEKSPNQGPGPELDRMVGERVMGWVEGKDFEAGPYGLVLLSRPGPIDLWTPSRDIGDAWSVVEELSARCYVEIHNQVHAETPLWHVAFHSKATSEFLGSATAASLPLAVCLAALRAAAREAREDEP